MSQDLGYAKGGSIGWLVVGIGSITQQVVAAGVAARFRFVEVRGITMDVQDHITCTVADSSMGMRCTVV
jgi:hypothetical protein